MTLKVKLIAHTPNPEEVVAQAAKLCYSHVGVDGIMEKLTPEKIEKFVDHLATIGHESPLEHVNFTFAIEGISRACYDKNTEIYTDQGWKLFKDLDGTEKVLSRNADGTYAFEKPLNYTRYHFKGQLHKYKSQNVDLCITPNHNMFMKKYDIRTESDYELIPSEDIKVNRFYVTKEIRNNNETPKTFIIPKYSYLKKLNNGKTKIKTLPQLELDSKEFIKFLAWYLSEGSTYYNERENSYSISISQSNHNDKNINNIEEIKGIISKLGFKPYYDGHNIKFKNSQLGLYLKSLGRSCEKYIPKEIFNSINKELAMLFIETYEKADGTVDKNNCSKLFTTSKELSDQLQIICFIAGYTGKIHIDNRVGESHYSKKSGNIIKHNHVCYVLNISKSKRNRTPIIKKDRHMQLINYDDEVYCVEVPNHVIFVRRNGCCLWCGNCSHQLVRHRLASYSQQSQRYVKLDQFEYIVPPAIAKDSYARTIFTKHMEDSQKAYDELVDTLIENKLDKKYPTWIEDTEDEYTKLSSEEQLQLNQNIRNLWAKNHKKEYSAMEKEAIEDARYVFPNACETKIVCTMNARSLLHFFNVRCCNRAQWEIRAMADEMLKECKKVAPTLFKKAGPDCTFGKCGEGSMSCGNPRKPEDFVGKMHEWCPECDTENEFPLESKPHKCKKCGKELKPCSICYEDNTECNKCKFEK